MKRVNNFIGYAPDVSGIYTNYQNKTTPIVPSYNSLLSKALEESYTLSAREIISKDKELTILTKGEIYEYTEPYLKLYPKIMEKYGDNFLEMMKINLKNAMERNKEDLDINFGQQEEKENIKYDK